MTVLQNCLPVCRWSFFLWIFFLCNFSKIQGEYCVINTEHFPTIGMFAAANLLIGKIHLYEKGELPNCQGLKVDFGQFLPFMSLGRKDAMPFVPKVLYLAKRLLT